MLTKDYVRTLTAALYGLSALVVLIVLLTFSLFLVWPNSSAATTAAPTGGQLAPATQAVALTAEQEHGKSIFTGNCAQCHAVTDEVVVGPGLKGVRQRTPGDAWLSKWIRNSQAVVASGDAYGVQVYNKFGKVAMSSFPQLTDQDISDILNYLDAAGK